MNTEIFNYASHRFVEVDLYTTLDCEGVICMPCKCLECGVLVYRNRSKSRFYNEHGYSINGVHVLDFAHCPIDKPVYLVL